VLLEKGGERTGKEIENSNKSLEEKSRCENRGERIRLGKGTLKSIPGGPNRKGRIQNNWGGKGTKSQVGVDRSKRWGWGDEIGPGPSRIRGGWEKGEQKIGTQEDVRGWGKKDES